MKTTLYNNTIESLQTDPSWKAFIDALVDDCHIVNDENLLAETENGLILLSDSEDDLQAKYATLSFKKDLMRMNITDNISLTSFLRMLSLYGAKIREVNKPLSLPHTYLVQSSEKDDGVWGYKKTDITDDHKANVFDPDDNTNSLDVYASIPNQSDNYYEEDTRYKYIYDIYGYNQKESVLYYSELNYVKDFYKFTNSKISDCNFYVSAEDIISIDSLDNEWYITFQTDYPKIWYDKNTSGSDKLYEAYSDFMEVVKQDEQLNKMTLVQALRACLTPVVENNNFVIERRFISYADNDYAALDTYVILFDNKPDDVYKDGIIKYNHDDYRLDTYVDVRCINKKTGTIESFDFTCTQQYINGLNNNKLYIYEVGPNLIKMVIENKAPKNFTGLFNKSILIDEPIYSDECGLKVQPVFVYPNKYSDSVKYSVCGNFNEVVGGLNKPSYQILVDTHKIKSESVSFSNNLTTYEYRIPTSISYGDYYRIFYLFNSDENKEQGEFIEECYSNDDFTAVGNTIEFFSKNTAYKYKIESYSSRTRTLVLTNTSSLYREYKILEATNKTKKIETMYFNHIVKVYPIYNGLLNDENPTIETTTMYCDNLELVQYGDCIPYLVSYVRKGELKEDAQSDKDIADLDCSVFAKIICYNKHTHVITVNNPIVFQDANTPRHLVVAYQNLSPFNRPESITVTVDSEPIKSIVSDLSQAYNNDSCKINIYTDREYEDIVADRVFVQEKNKRETIVKSLIEIMNAKQQPEHAVVGVYNVSQIGDGLISANINGTNKTAIKSNGYFYFTNDGPIQSFEFEYGSYGIEAIRFKDAVLQGGNGLFGNVNGNSFNRLKLIEGLAFNNHTWDKGDFSSCSNLYSVNSSAFTFKLSSETGIFSQYNLMKDLKYIQNADINVEFDSNTPTKVYIDMSSWFKNCNNLENVRIKFVNRQVYVTKMNYTFQDCHRLRYIDLSGLDFSELKSAICTFNRCYRLEEINVKWGENEVLNNVNSIFSDCYHLKEYGDLSGWKNGSITAGQMFMRCRSMQQISIPFAINYASSDIFHECEAETISVKHKLDCNRLVMPKLKTFGILGGFIIGNSFELNTPELTRSGWQKFISTIETTRETSTIRLHNNVFKRLIKNVDYVVDNELYYVADRSDIQIIIINV